MIKAFLDSNIWIRPLVETSLQAKHATQIIEAIDGGNIKPYTSTIVLIEVSFVLHSVYKIPSSSINSDLGDILETKNLTLIEKTNFKSALSLHQQTHIKLTDCLIALQIPKEVLFISYDKELRKIPNIKVTTPSEILQSLNV